jgi:hypothetical protein
MLTPAPVFIALFVLELLLVVIGVCSVSLFVWRRKWFPINTRKPFLTVICFVGLSVYCVSYALTILFPDSTPCFNQAIVDLAAFVFYNTILIRTFKLWFQGRLAEVKFDKQHNDSDTDKQESKVGSWFLRNRRLVEDRYLLG